MKLSEVLKQHITSSGALHMDQTATTLAIEWLENNENQLENLRVLVDMNQGELQDLREFKRSVDNCMTPIDPRGKK